MANTVTVGEKVKNYLDLNDGKYKQVVTDPGVTRTIKDGESGADEYFMTDADYAKTQANSAQWEKLNQQLQQAKQADDGETAARLQADMDALHAENEAVRYNYGYQGGTSGGLYLTLGQLGLTNSSKTRSSGSSSTASKTATIDPATEYGSNADAQKALLEQWKAAATEQANAQIDYNVSTNTKELERALQDAQPQFQEQAESVARDERQAMDNSALYAELRGDKGGIGQSQYNEIQAAAAQNKLAVQQAQTKLSTDTARQIEDLRAQGEFEKADAALQISQQYLSQLMSLEQWAAEYNLNAAQFEAAIQEWEYEYQLSLAQLKQNQSQFNAQMAYNYASLGQNQSQFDATMNYNTTLNTQSNLASMGKALLSAGIMPSTDQLSAMGLTSSQATQYLQAAQLAAASKSSSSKSSSSKSGGSETSAVSSGYVEACIAAGKTTLDSARNYLMNTYGLGYNTANSYAKEAMAELESTPISDVSELGATAKNIANQMSRANSTALLSTYSEIIKNALSNGSITEKEADFLLRSMGY